MYYDLELFMFKCNDIMTKVLFVTIISLQENPLLRFLGSIEINFFSYNSFLYHFAQTILLVVVTYSRHYPWSPFILILIIYAF